jgi:hypothetical protein
MTGPTYDALSWAGGQPAFISAKDATHSLNSAIMRVRHFAHAKHEPLITLLEAAEQVRAAQITSILLAK